MRVQLAIFVVVLAIYLGVVLQGAKTNIPFSTKDATRSTYSSFIDALRAHLTNGVPRVSGIPVLPSSSSVPDSRRFVLVDLSNNVGNTITVAIDVVNVYVVAFLVRDQVYFFRDAPEAAFRTLFKETNINHHNLSYSGNYVDLERRSQSRELTDLGLSNLDHAISRLWYDRSDAAVASSFLVIIQMVSEAVRFRFIETRIRQSITSGTSFRPDPAMLSLENGWSSLSTAIQSSLDGVVFSRSVTLRSVSNNPVIVESTLSPVIAGLALLLYRCPGGGRGSNDAIPALPGSITRIPFSSVGDADECTILGSTRRISGRDGLCVDVRDGRDNDGNPIQLWPCGQQSNQQWTFQTDGTIRSLGKCMTTYGYSPGVYITIFNCGTAAQNATKWSLSSDGTITNPHSGLVLTANQAAQGTILTVETNVHAASQGWRVLGEEVNPTVTTIIGFNDLCMQANNDNSRVWLESCVDSRQQQQWALYGDGTIRVNSDHNLCLTSDGHSSLDVIIILRCQGWGNQRWVFNSTDGTILNPNAKLVMDVKESNVSLRQIILYQPTGNPNQRWLPYF
ncbi:ribosome-inactivating protein PMRIPt-like [Rhododendron vialii]|uniref:ribosome-inactivating protein PMRIPt-like n=1 Tax=Rhododendron vialii TaxID=182163 RepID=UPI00265E1BD8|nr:ribosome-inactivating protein PMRIPt-like [Rhododendron vialii]